MVATQDYIEVGFLQPGSHHVDTKFCLSIPRFITKKVSKDSQRQKIKMSQNLDVVCLYARSYHKTVSYSRFMSHIDAARSFRNWLKQTSPTSPDIILASFPVEELCFEAAKYAEQRNIPVIMDCRDFWPDIFSEVLPNFLKILAPIALFPLNTKVKRTLKKAHSICGHTASAMFWGLKKANIVKRPSDFHFPFTYDDADIQHSIENVDNLGRLTFCFVGAISKRSNLEMFVDALSRLTSKERSKIEFKIAGLGDHGVEIRKLALKKDVAVTFLGWLDKPDLQKLMNNSDFGLLPYNRPDFHLSLPNKLSEYLALGVPIFSFTEGEVKNFINANHAGIWCEAEPDKIAATISNILERGVKKNPRYYNQIYLKNFSQNLVFKKVENHMEQIVSKVI